jgi:hypothetical protein
MHKEIIMDEKKQLTQEQKDIDHLKLTSKPNYDEAEGVLNEQDAAISKASEAIHRIRNR